MLHRSLLTKSALIVAAMALYLFNSAPARAEGEHRALRAALWHLKQAKEEVRDERIGKHRERVERDLRTATEEIERALGEAKIKPDYKPEKGWEEKHKTFKNLRQSLIELDAAKADLKTEKGDWARRKELIRAIEDAHEHIEDALKEIK